MGTNGSRQRHRLVRRGPLPRDSVRLLPGDTRSGPRDPGSLRNQANRAPDRPTPATGTARHETAPEFPARTSHPHKLAAGAAQQAAGIRGDGSALAMAAKAQLTAVPGPCPRPSAPSAAGATGRSSGARPGITSRPDRGRGGGRDTARGPAADTGDTGVRTARASGRRPTAARAARRAPANIGAWMLGVLVLRPAGRSREPAVTNAALDRRGRGAARTWSPGRARCGTAPAWRGCAVRRLRPAVTLPAWGDLRWSPRGVACTASRPR